MNAIHNILDFEEEKEVKSETSFSKPKPSVCPICSHRCESKKSLERHHSDVHKKQSYKCTRCGLRGARFRTMLKHYRSFHDKEVDSKTGYEESVTDFEFSWWICTFNFFIWSNKFMLYTEARNEWQLYLWRHNPLSDTRHVLTGVACHACHSRHVSRGSRAIWSILALLGGGGI